MIQYALKCVDGHSFDSWFQSAGAFDKLVAAEMVSCAVCGTTQVEKAIMTPRVSSVRAPEADKPAPSIRLSSPAERAIRAMRRRIERESDYVGLNFAAEARAMHEGDAPERAIYGEARPEDARKLVEDGVPVAPLPFLPNRRNN